jgi:hypothetical protein
MARLAEQQKFTVTPSPTATVPSATPASATPTVLANSATEPVAAGGGDRAEFVDDITVRDGSLFPPGQAFVKTWRLINNGTSTWTPSYSLAFINGEQMGGPLFVSLPGNVPPGQTVDISVNLVAPTNPGGYRGFWILKNASGQTFGVGVNGTDSIWVDISVEGQAAATGTVTPTPGTIVSQVGLGVDNATATTCPHTFTFTAQFTLSRPAAVTYQIEASTSTPGLVLQLPPAATTNLQAGTHSVIFTLNFTSPISGVARFHITAPEEAYSAPVNFTLTCPYP